MSDGPNKMSRALELPAIGSADSLATRALSVVANRVRPGNGRLRQGVLERLEASLLTPERTARQAAVQSILSTGISWEEIVDRYIPEAARRLGEMWCADEVSFAEVTIGSARLQSMLRDLGPAPGDGRLHHLTAPNVALIVRQDDYHTLGAMVVAAQLRRLGASVRLSLGQPDSLIVDQLETKLFDAIFISASSSEKLDSIRNLVKKIRKACVPEPPIVVGGTILETDRDAKGLSDADHATSDPLEAVKLCGLKMPSHDARYSEIGS